jgi:hypothetical protein
VAWTSDSTGRWARNWLGWDGFSKFFSQLVGWTFPGEETGGIEATFETVGNETRLKVESVAEDGSPRDFYSTGAVVVGPDLEPRTVNLSQIAPGVYDASLGEIDSGAYAIRVSQTRPGSPALGRTVGLVAPTAAEYRLLGANQAFLAVLRSATGGAVIDTPAQPWIHDLATTTTYTDLWPLMLIVALLLWPLDIALRRVSVGRRELADARRWVGGGWRRQVAPRPVEVAGMLAARDRAAGSAARAAMSRDDRAAATGPAAPAPPHEHANGTPAARVGVKPPAPTLDAGAAPAATPTIPAPAAPAEPGDTLARLRDAKRRRSN